MLKALHILMITERNKQQMTVVGEHTLMRGVFETTGRRFKSHPVHFLLRGNYGIKLSSF